MECGHSLNADNIGSRTSDVGTHTVQEVRHINNMGLLRRILNRSIANCHGCRHHNINGRTYGHNIQINVASA